MQNFVCGKLIKRTNRFVAKVDIDGEEFVAHVPNSGRMKELLIPGNKVILEKKEGKNRKTPFDLLMVEVDGQPVFIDSRIPNILIAEAINDNTLPEFKGLYVKSREVSYGNSRLDIELMGENKGFCEVKSVTLVKRGVAMFPDAPTARGTKHLLELIRAKKEGYKAFVVFVVQRDDAVSFSPNKETDIQFALTLKEALNAGVEILAYTCRVSLKGIAIKERIPVEFNL